MPDSSWGRTQLQGVNTEQRPSAGLKCAQSLRKVRLQQNVSFSSHEAEARGTVLASDVWSRSVSWGGKAVWVELALGEEKGGWYLHRWLLKIIPKHICDVALSGDNL